MIDTDVIFLSRIVARDKFLGKNLKSFKERGESVQNSKKKKLVREVAD